MKEVVAAFGRSVPPLKLISPSLPLATTTDWTATSPPEKRLRKPRFEPVPRIHLPLLESALGIVIVPAASMWLLAVADPSKPARRLAVVDVRISAAPFVRTTLATPLSVEASGRKSRLLETDAPSRMIAPTRA